MTRLESISFAAAAVLTVSLLGACATASGDAGDLRPDDIVSVPLTRSRVADDGDLASRSAVLLAPTAAGESEPVRREEALRRELGLDRAPDGSWDGCFMRGWGDGC